MRHRMNKRKQIELSLDLEKRLEQAAENIRQAIIKPATIKSRFNLLRRGGRVIEPVPDDVKDWFEETEDDATE